MVSEEQYQALLEEVTSLKKQVGYNKELSVKAIKRVDGVTKRLDKLSHAFNALKEFVMK